MLEPKSHSILDGIADLEKKFYASPSIFPLSEILTHFEQSTLFVFLDRNSVINYLL